MESWLSDITPEVIGVSGVVAAIVTYILDRFRGRQQRRAQREEEHLRYSVENYPRFAAMLNEMVRGLREANRVRVTESGDGSERFDVAVMNVLFWMGRLQATELRFREEQGRMFRLENQPDEILARFLYDLGKENLGMSSTRIAMNSGRLSMYQENHLLQVVASSKTLDDFLAKSSDDPVIHEVRENIGEVIHPTRGGEWSEKDFDVLSRLLLRAIERIRLPGRRRQPVPASRPDRDFLAAFKRTATTFVSRSSLNTQQAPLKIWVYNHWMHPIRFAPDEVQLRIYKQSSGGALSEDQRLVDLKLLDPDTHEHRLVLESGETACAFWDRADENGLDDGEWYKVVYLPDSEPKDSGTTSAFAFDYYLDRKGDKQTWRLRSSFQ